MFDARPGSPYAYRHFLAGTGGPRLGHVMGSRRVGDLAKVTATTPRTNAIDVTEVTTIVPPPPSGSDAFGPVVVIADTSPLATSIGLS